eukprot:1140952-Pelagomonas_calceolata.AAC.1
MSEMWGLQHAEDMTHDAWCQLRSGRVELARAPALKEGKFAQFRSSVKMADRWPVYKIEEVHVKKKVVAVLIHEEKLIKRLYM